LNEIATGGTGRRSGRIHKNTKRKEEYLKELETENKTSKKRPREDSQRMKESSALQHKEYVVEKIIDDYFDNESNEQYYRVRWQGFPKSYDLWLPEKDLTKAQQILTEYQQQKRRENLR
jgi:hypothetical protein